MNADDPPDPLPSTAPMDRSVRTAAYDGRAADQLLAGRYRLLEPVGEGGMGTVWKAEQTEPVRRLVAVKLIRAGADSKAVLARFEAERQALAMMDHPNIAKVLDADVTDDGRPFFVMELVRGVPITQHCLAKHLTPRERLALFIPVCQAIQHAHQKGIIHRDIKPSNVLVAEYDGKPVPKVIDFGVAKAAGGRLTDSTLQTGHGAIVGTPEYMSPEQAADSADIDTRSDVYALGVLLYEMLTGSPPHDRARLKAAGLIEILRIVREEEPRPPSSKLTGIRVPNVQELDWIVLKALEKDRSRRYDSANALAADVERHLANETVSAGPPGAGYRLRKFVRRHRGPVLAAVVVVLALVAGFAGTLWGLFEARSERDAADAARSQAMRDKQDADEARAAETAQREKANDALRQAQQDRAVAVEERAEKERAAVRADGLRLGAESTAVLRTDPGLALRLAGDGAKRHPHHLTFAALYDAAAALHEVKTIPGLRAPFAVRPDGKGFACGVQSPFVADRSKCRAIALFDAAGNPGVTWPGYGLEVGAIAFSPDGTRVACALVGSMLAEIGEKGKSERALYTSRVVYVWDAASGKDLLHLRGHGERVVSIEFSSDGKRILTASHDGTARLWNAGTGEPIGVPMVHDCSLSLARFGPDGSKILAVPSGRIEYDNGWKEFEKLPMPPRIDPGPTDKPIRLLHPAGRSSGSASAGDEYAARVWDAATSKQVAGLRRARSATKLFHNWTITQGRFSPDGSRVLLAFTDDVAGEWDATKGGSELYLLTGHVGEVADARYGSNGTTIQTVGRDGKLLEYRTGSGDAVTLRTFGTGPKSALLSSKDERQRLVFGERDLLVLPGESHMASGDISYFVGHRGRVLGAGFLAGDTAVASLGADDTVRLWSVAKPAELARTVTLGTPGVAAFDVSPDGKLLAVAGKGDGATVRILDAATGAQLCEIGKDAVLGSIRTVRFNPDGTQVVTASDVTTGSRGGKVVNNSAVHVWDAKTGEDYYSFPTHVYGAQFAAFLPDGRRILTVSDGYKRGLGGTVSGSRSDGDKQGIVRVWEAATRKVAYEVVEKVNGSDPPSIARDGRAFGLMTQRGAAAFDATTGMEIWRAQEPIWQNAIAFYSGSARAATWGNETFHLRDPATGATVSTLPVPTVSSTPVYSPDGKVLAVPAGSTVSLFRVESGTAGPTLVGHEGHVRGVSFSRDGRSCLTFADDRTATVWELPAGKLKTVYRSPAEIRFAAFLPAGGIATAGDDGIVRFWPADPVAELLKRTPRELTDAEKARYGP